MPKCLYIVKSVFIIGVFLLGINKSISQCTPAPAETCDETTVFCSLDELNGYTCNNPSTTENFLRPGCGAGGSSIRTWWAFVSNGGSTTFTFTVGACNSCVGCNFGLVFGIWGDCQCVEEIACTPGCIPTNQSITYQVNLKPCKTYYISVDACCYCICDFTISTSGGGSPPNLSPLGDINNKANGIIDSVCVGACNYKLFVNPQPGGCSPNYVWTLDANEIGGNTNELFLNFPDEGDFVVCVTAYLGNPQSGSFCGASVGPKCATVKVRPLPDKIGIPRKLCWEQANPNGYQWHSQLITTSGIYTEHLTDSKCCQFDSVVEFTVLDVPVLTGKSRTLCWEQANPNGYKWFNQTINATGTYKQRFSGVQKCLVDSMIDFIVLDIPAKPDVFYITCNNDPYIDMLGRAYLPCKNQLEISLPKTTDPFKCDSAIRLTAVNVDYSPKLEIDCSGGYVQISPNISIINPCSVGESYEYEYKWYKRFDPVNIISKEERLLIDPVDESYCVDVNVTVRLGTEKLICSKTFCEVFRESNYAPICFPLVGDVLLCKGKSSIYKIDTLLNQTVLSYTWTVIDGIIVSNIDSPAVEVQWNLLAGDTGTICVFYNTECGKSCEKCLQVLIGSSSNPFAGPDDTICDLSYKFTGIKDHGGYWKQISGPGLSTITDTTDPQSNVVVDKNGMYRFVYIETIGACHNTDTVGLYFNSKTDTSRSFQYCDSVTINGKTYTQSANFTQQLKSVFGCDSIIKTDLVISKSSSTNLLKRGCDSIAINNQVYTQSGVYKQVLTNVSNCDSIINLELDIGKSSSSNLTVNACDSTIVNNQVYALTGIYKQILLNSTGCDSSLNLDITIQPSNQTDITQSGCDSIVFNNVNYTQSGIYQQLLRASNGCDSILYLDFRISPSNQTDLSQTGCDSIVINKVSYNQSGLYKQILQTANGCDSTLNLDLIIPSSKQIDISQSGCDSITINNIRYTQSGTYQQKLQTAAGCDSILNLQIEIQPGSRTDINKTDCDSVVFNGKVYKQSGDYTERHTSSNGCDSIIVLHVNIPNSNTSPLVLTRCDSVTINNVHYTQSGKYTQQLTSANGCDSILNIELEIQSSSQADYSQTGCDSVVVNNISYTQSGIYQQKLQTAAGCDSTLNIDLKIAKSSSGDTLYRSCDSVTINGITYHQTGIYAQILVNANQCDSTLIIDFTRLSKTSTALSLRSCDSLVINNQVYKQSGIYTQVLSNVNQCDSVLSLDVEIQSSSQADYSQTGCDSVSINGQTYLQSGSYRQLLTASNGCDSILNLELVVWKSGKEESGKSGCDSVVVNNINYTQSGLYQQLLQTAHGCDSTLNLNIEIRRSGEAEIGKEGCDSIIINNISYTKSGIYKQILQSTNGCDSTLTLDLTIKPGNPSTLDAGVDTSICEGEILKLKASFSGNAQFKWQGARGNFDFPDRLSTNYYSNSIGNERIYLQAVDDCKQWLDSLNVQILPNQFVRVTGDTIIDPCKDKEIRFTATGGNNYTWTPSSNIECLDPPCSHVLLKSNLASRFTITTDGPCAFPASLNLSLSETQSDVYLPTAFSPNGDNINDVFLPIFNCDQVTFFNLQIFDRWGNLMFESNDQYKGWDGKQNDVQMIPGVYPYVVEYELHGNVKKVKGGEVTLIK
jgi:gliding motility-associated-like protein